MAILKPLRLSLRSLIRDAATSFFVVFCLALGIGATTLIFSVVYWVLLKPLPFTDAEELVMLFDAHTTPGAEAELYTVSPPNYEAWRQQTESFTAVEAAQLGSFTLSAQGEPRKIEGAMISRGLMPLLGVEPLHGRLFTEEDDVPPGGQVVLLSHRLWSEEFGADPRLVGQEIKLNGVGTTVAGVMPAGVDFPFESSLWTPLALDPDKMPDRLWHFLHVVARIDDGISAERAQAELDVVAERLAATFPDTNSNWTARLVPLREHLSGEIRPALLLLLTAVAVVLLIALVNVVHLILARTQRRLGEVALRIALGAGKARIARQLLVESLLLAGAGGALGVLLAVAGQRPVAALIPAEFAAARGFEIDGTALAFTFGVSVACGVLVGLAPLLIFRGRNPRLQIQGGRGQSDGKHRRRLAAVLVVAEVAAATVLLFGSGLLLRSYRQLQEIDPGYPARGVLTMTVDLPETQYVDEPARLTFFEELLPRVEALPGVASASVASVLPIGDRPNSALFSVEGREVVDENEMLLTNNRFVSAGYLETIGIPVLRGRTLEVTDRAGSPGVVVVSETFARRFWPEQQALGKRVKRGSPDSENPWLTVVGVARDVQDQSLTQDAGATWYLPFTQHYFWEMNLVIRVAVEPLSLAPLVRDQVWSVDPEQPIENIKTLEQRLGQSVSGEHFRLFLLITLAAIALVLATAGIYGVTSYSVGRRTHEIGVRMALGSRRGDVLWMVMRQTATLAAAGLALGLLAAVLLARFASSFLYAVPPYDPRTLLTTAAGLLVISLLATLIPARRAAALDPMRSLRQS